MTRALLLVLPWVVALGIGCGGGRGSTGARTTVAGAQERALRVEAPGPGAERYESESRGRGLIVEGASGGQAPEAARVAAAVRRGLGGEGDPPQGDQRLARLAALAREVVIEEAGGPPRVAVEFLARHLGLPDTPVAVGLAALPPGGELEEAVADLAGRLAARVPGATHFGLAVREEHGLRLVSLALGRRAVQLRPLPRYLAEPGALRLRGRIDARFARPRVQVEGAEVRAREGLGARRFEATIRFAEPGTFRVRLLAEGPLGTETLLDLPVHVGEPPPRLLVVPLGQEGGQDPGEAGEELLRRVQALRAERGLPALEADALLDRIAETHARELVRRGALDHRDERGEGPDGRLRRARYPFRRVRENLGVGADAETLLQGWLRSASHREALLDPAVRRIGLGLVRRPATDGGGLLAVALLVAPVERIDTERAPAELLRRIDRARRARRARPLRVDEKLQEAAAVAARRYFEEPGIGERQLVEEASASLRRFAIAFGRVGGVMVVVGDLEQAAHLEPLFDPTARYVGVGVAQGQRPGGPPNQIVVVYLLGWPR